MKRRPVIGISGSMEPQKRKVFLLQAYFDAVSRAGGLPVLLDPAADEQAIREYASLLDGLMLAGGGDVEPQHFGQDPIEQLGETTPLRDRFELALLKEAARAGLPVFGICRGLQVMNVAAGGTLYQDLKTQHPESGFCLLEHKQQEAYEIPSHEVTIMQNSLLSSLNAGAGDNAMVNSMHHQAIARVSPEYRVTAVGRDGVIEAIEHRSRQNWFAVQWHPERLEDRLSRSLFETFVGFAAVYREEKV